MSDNITLIWFRDDLRLQDSPAINAALNAAACILPVYIHDTDIPGVPAAGGASLWWRHHSLHKLNESLNGKLVFRTGNTAEHLLDLCHSHGVNKIYWHKSYDPAQYRYDEELAHLLGEAGIEVKQFRSYLLFEPQEIQNKSGKPYRVFTPFYKTCLEHTPPPAPLETDEETLKRALYNDTTKSEEINLLSTHSWHKKLEKHWQPGHLSAQQALATFLENGLALYKDKRDFPSIKATSTLSPYLHFGEITPRMIWHEAESYAAQNNIAPEKAAAFTRQLVWREFSYHLLWQEPDMKRTPLQEKFRHFPWHADDEKLSAWQKGLTGYPIIDAGMRELWDTGIMHNRLRMIVGSFLVKNLLIHWHEGEKWFWDCLVDADHGNNAMGWQWISGCGADAAPYFRIFNPLTQSRKFDPNGTYIRKWVPELAELNNEQIHAPWELSDMELNMAGITRGKTYPQPIVDLQETRQRALDAYDEVKNNVA